MKAPFMFFGPSSFSSRRHDSWKVDGARSRVEENVETGSWEAVESRIGSHKRGRVDGSRIHRLWPGANGRRCPTNWPLSLDTSNCDSGFPHPNIIHPKGKLSADFWEVFFRGQVKAKFWLLLCPVLCPLVHLSPWRRRTGWSVLGHLDIGPRNVPKAEIFFTKAFKKLKPSLHFFPPFLCLIFPFPLFLI